MLKLENIILSYGRGTPSEVTALAGLSLSVPTGEFVTVVGSNGAGKSSMIQVISGAVRPTSGQVIIANKDVTRQSDFRRAGKVARVFDNPHIGSIPTMSIEENMALAMARGRRRGLRMAVGRHQRVAMRDALSLLDLGLENRLTDPVRLLSAGQRQSLTMVMAALTTPEVMLLDEHLAALDPGTQKRVLEITVKLVEALGCTTIMVTHNMEHAIAVGDRLIVMSRGRIINEFAKDEKRFLTIRQLIERIVGSGDIVSDRLAFSELNADPLDIDQELEVSNGA